MTEINPSSMASQLATASVQGAQDSLNTRSTNAKAVSSALTKLQSALQAFDTALVGLSGKKGLQQYSAAFGTAGYGSVTASSSAQPGTYSLFVQQLASAHQVAFQNLDAALATPTGTLNVKLAGGPSFDVDFTGADADGSGKLSTSEIARAINLAAGNAGQVNAMLVTVNGQSQLVLSAASTGGAGKITLDTIGLPPGALQTALSGPGTELSPAKDAIVWLGGENAGVKLEQASNTFTAIPGVSMTFTQAQASGSAPLMLTVAGDQGGTAANVRTFVDAYNALNKTLDELTDVGSPNGGKAAGAFASDAGIRALRSRLNTLVHQQVGGLRLMDFGITMDRYGTLALDESKLQKGLAASPEGLDALFGSTGLTTGSGMLGSLDKYLQGWLNSASGQIKQRKDSVQSLQKSISARQVRLEDQYSRTYDRYLKQFTKLQQLQSQMGQTSDMFQSLSANSS